MNDDDQVQVPAAPAGSDVAPEVEDEPIPDADPAVPQGSADTDDDEDDDDAPAANGKPKSKPNGIYVSTPPVLKEKIEAEAAAVGKTPRAFVRDLLAEKWGLVLTPARTRTVYADPEEKKRVQKEKRNEKNALIKRLLEAHEKAQAEAAAEAAKLGSPPSA